jgi:hypothetical protein
VFRLLKPAEFAARPHDWNGPLHNTLSLKLITIDGKTVRRLLDRGSLSFQIGTVG